MSSRPADPARAADGRNGHEDIDPAETREWLEAVEDLLREYGPGRTADLLGQAVTEARLWGAPVPVSDSTPYINTIPPEDEPPMPGDPEVERRLRSAIRWNAAALVLQANKESSELGGHIASFQSAATLYEVGFNHFWHARSAEHGGDLVYIQGHSSPGIYARAFLEGRLDEDQLRNFRREVGGEGVPSYPHPWLMPDFWQFPTVSMGLGPIMAIYQARFMKYLQGREIVGTEGRRVWAFMGDGEMDEPESMGAISLAGRERLDNLVFVVNCNLQRLDGPVRGNGKIIQELETNFRGAGWNVIKVVWGENWDPLLAADHDGLLRRRMEEAVDGEYQTFKSRDADYVREHFFGAYPELKRRVAHMSDPEIWALNRGGHSPRKVYAAYHAAMHHEGQPTVILAKTIKGYGMGRAGEGQNITHQQKKMNEEALLAFRDRFGVPLTDEQARDAVFYRPPEDSPEMRYLREHREALGGSLPARRPEAEPLEVPPLEAFDALLKSTGDRTISTTMAFVRALGVLVRDRALGQRVVPIVPDESRTFGMEGMFRQLGIFSQVGQLYKPEDAEQLMFYREDKKGQMLEEGITEAGAISSWIAAATSYANHGVAMVPFYIFYSMFGFQRVGDLAWAAGDSRARGFLVGGTAGRTTLNGEGLQHQDGHSHLLASAIPNCVAYDPTFAYELAIILQDGLRRMLAEREDVFYYVTVMNENYVHPAMPEGCEEGVLRGMHLIHEGEGDGPRVQMMGSGTILREVVAAAELLQEDYGVLADVWSATSWTELRRDGMEVERWNRLHPLDDPRQCWVEACLGDRDGPVVAASDYVRAWPEGIRPWVRGRFTVLGTDGYGRSDRRVTLRRFFEVDRHHIAVAALHALGQEGVIDPAIAAQAIAHHEIDPEAAPPWQR
ncbi:MAG TPA: pyruvate dehydrogenase (acetyl-transferring), homodimeric type [Miltoncostaeaceae bacterium]|nr:pyruvate dehydrogenase (acetyl-transferring), homodimeric type [Miltoncostaeaceae bacterium]